MLGIGKWKTESWDGEVVGKNSFTDTDSEGFDSNTMYYLQVKMADGAVKRKYCKEEVWRLFQVGDRVVKRPGERQPAKPEGAVTDGPSDPAG